MTAATNGNHAQNGGGGRSLFDRIEEPHISKAAKRDIALLEREFLNVEIEQCVFLFPLTSCVFFPFFFFFFCFGFSPFSFCFLQSGNCDKSVLDLRFEDCSRYIEY
jgi:hypothetical protein